MSVPKAAVDEYHALSRGENNIGRTREIFIVESEAKAEPVKG